MSIHSIILPRFIGAAVIVIGLIGPSLAQGSAFLARADASLVINEITPSDLGSGVDVLVDSGVTEIAPRRAAASHQLDIVDDLENLSIAMGTFVDGQIGGFASIQSVALVVLSNNSGGDVELGFALSWRLEAATPALLCGCESSAFAEFLLDVVGNVGAAPGFIRAIASADTSGGPLYEVSEDSAGFSLRIAAGEAAKIELQTRSSGNSVPIPPTLVLLSLGLGVLWRLRGRVEG